MDKTIKSAKGKSISNILSRLNEKELLVEIV